MMKSWRIDIDSTERTRRLLDLFMVSVLLDAGAGNKWQYKASNGKIYRRSEGLAVASLDMFREGLFSSNPAQKDQVDGKQCRFQLSIMKLTRGIFRHGFEAVDR
jgi:hypothetical protein